MCCRQLPSMGYKKMRKYRFKPLMPLKLSQLMYEKIQKAVNADAAEVTAKTVCNAHGLLSSALGMFYPDFVLRTTLPKKQKRLKRDLPTPQQVYKAVKGSDIETPVLFAMWLGLRMSELRGIRTNEDIVGNTLYIRHVIVTVDRKPVEKNLTKTEISTRIYKLPDELLSKVDFSKPHITELTDSTLYSRFVAAIEKAGLPHMTFHDLRHSCASLLLANGVPMKQIQEWLGHSDFSTTANIYAHLDYSSKLTSADAMLNGLGFAQN